MTPEERCKRAVIHAAKEWRGSGTVTGRLALTEAIDALNAIETTTKEDAMDIVRDVPTTYLAAVKRHVTLEREEAVLLQVSNYLRGAVNDQTGGERAFHVASKPNLVVVVQWFPANLTTVRIMELVSP